MNKRQDERGVAFTLGAKIRETGEREFTSVLGVFIIFLELGRQSNTLITYSLPPWFLTTP